MSDPTIGAILIAAAIVVIICIIRYNKDKAKKAEKARIEEERLEKEAQEREYYRQWQAMKDTMPKKK